MDLFAFSFEGSYIWENGLEVGARGPSMGVDFGWGQAGYGWGKRASWNGAVGLLKLNLVRESRSVPFVYTGIGIPSSDDFGVADDYPFSYRSLEFGGGVKLFRRTQYACDAVAGFELSAAYQQRLWFDGVNGGSKTGLVFQYGLGIYFDARC